MGKERLDLLMVQKGLATSREQARSVIMAGSVTVDGEVVDKAGTKVEEESTITVSQQPKYVSRGGIKLEHALEAFGVEVTGLVAADVGASTGGFTDCLLQRGAARVYAIDVGYGQLDWKLRTDPRVVVIERTNARYLSSLPEPVDLATIDASFISLRLILPSVAGWLKPSGRIVALVKPQFEAGRAQVGKGGVVSDPLVHRSVLRGLADWGDQQNCGVRKLTVSPLRGPAGNVEFLALLIPGELGSSDIDDQIAAVVEEARSIGR